MRVSIGRVLLSVCVAIVGVVLGAGVYEALVIVPLWSSGPPDSLVAFNTQALMPQAGPRFWMFATPFMALVALVNLIVALRSKSPARGWWIAGSAGIVSIVAVTFTYFVPLLMKIHAVGNGGETVPAESVEMWVALNWVRAVLIFASWCCLFTAYGKGAGATVPAETRSTSLAPATAAA